MQLEALISTNTLIDWVQDGSIRSSTNSSEGWEARRGGVEADSRFVPQLGVDEAFVHPSNVPAKAGAEGRRCGDSTVQKAQGVGIARRAGSCAGPIARLGALPTRHSREWRE